jgi:small subunit ribosomal protein S1
VDTQNQEFASPTSIEDLKPKMKLRGTVTQVELAGAVVDVGVGQNGLVHISRLSKDPIRNASDAASPGQELTVWVQYVEPNAGRIDLTCVEPLALDWQDIRAGQTYTGTVVRIEQFGAFVDIEAEKPGLVHVSELSNEYVGNTSDVVSVGQEVTVRVLKVDRRKRQIDLSIKALEAEEIEQIFEEEAGDEEELPTAMAIALKRAMDDTDADDAPKPAAKKSASNRQRDELENIIARTLQQHEHND